MIRREIENAAGLPACTRRRASLGVLALGMGLFAPGLVGCAEASESVLPLLSAGSPGPRQPRANYYVDVRKVIGGDGEIARALMLARDAGLGAWLAPGSYTVDGECRMDGMRIEASDEASVVARGAATAMFSARGQLIELPAPRFALEMGATRVELASPAALAPKDRVILFDHRDSSWHGARPYYRAGEWLEVASSSGAVVGLAAPLAASYRAGTLSAYLVRPSRAELVGGNWQSGDKALVFLSLCVGALVDVNEVRARANAAIELDRCSDTQVRVADGSNAGVGRDDYLVSIANSQSVRVIGGRLHARRHPVAIGGGDVVAGVPNRDCLVEGGHLSNDPDTGVACGDLHGNTELCGYDGCEIEGGIVLAGLSPIARRCTISARVGGNVVESSELKGGRVDLTGTRIISDAVNVGGGRGLIDLGTQNSSFNAFTTRDVLVDLRRFSLSAPRLAEDEAVIRMSNQGSPARLDILIEDGSLDLPHSVRLVRTGSGNALNQGEIVVRRLAGLPPRSTVHFAEMPDRDRMLVRSAR